MSVYTLYVSQSGVRPCYHLSLILTKLHIDLNFVTEILFCPFAPCLLYPSPSPSDLVIGLFQLAGLPDDPDQLVSCYQEIRSKSSFSVEMLRDFKVKYLFCFNYFGSIKKM